MDHPRRRRSPPRPRPERTVSLMFISGGAVLLIALIVLVVLLLR